MCPRLELECSLDEQLPVPLRLEATILARLTDAHCHPSDDSQYSGPSFVTNLKLGIIVSL